MVARLATLLLTAISLAACSSEPEIAKLDPIEVTSTAFADGEPIPVEHTCDGADTPVPLAWAAVPDAAAEVVVRVDDPDAPGERFVHWLLAGIDPDAGTVSAGAVQGTNGFGDVGYAGPCPPPGDDAHRYVFTVYALAEPSGLAEGFSAEELTAVLGSAIGAGDLDGSYARQEGR